MKTTTTVGDNGRVRGAQITLDAPDPIVVSRQLGLRVGSTWRTTAANGDTPFAITDVGDIQTESRRTREWMEHIRLHDSVRVLLSLACWKSLGFSHIEALRDDEPHYLGPDREAPRWNSVTTYVARGAVPWPSDPQYLFTFADIGISGLRRWKRLHAQFGEAIGAIGSILDMNTTYYETELIQSSIALESLGWRLAEMKGSLSSSELRSGRVPFARLLAAVVGDMSFVPIDDVEAWIVRSKEAYRGTKHADATALAPGLAINTLRENLLIFRCWLAEKLGCPTEVLRSRLPLDPHGTAWNFA